MNQNQNSNSRRNKDECSNCMKSLVEALGSSRPRQLLAAMGYRAFVDKDNSEVSIMRDINEVGDKGGRRRDVLPGIIRVDNAPQNTMLVAASSVGLHEPSGMLSSTAATALKNNYGDESNRRRDDGSVREKKFFTEEQGMKVQCTMCGDDGPEGGARAFVKGPDPVSVVLCANRLSSQKEVEEVLVHELIHVYDVRQRKMDLRNCEKLAYSEVRAAREAECHSSSRFTKSYCIREKATVATENMFPEKGRTCVCSVFEKALKDMSPFSSGPKSSSR